MLSERHIAFFNTILSDAAIVDQDNVLFERYAKDTTENYVFFPDLVLIPDNVAQISKIVSYCNHHLIPITPRGAGTGLAGGALPTNGGVLLSTEKLNKILHIDEDNLQVTAEPAVITEILQDAVSAKGLFYPPDPASKGSCFIGGNIAHNSGGPKAVKYGVVRDYVLNLEVVLPTGEVIWTGANTLKNSTGYNLTQLIVGSEGTLGIITKIVLKLLPLPKADMLMFASFKTVTQASQAVSAIFKAGITPSGLEFMERAAFDIASNYIGQQILKIKEDDQAFLLIEVDGNHLSILRDECESIANVLYEFGVDDILLADSAAQKNLLWKIRKSINPAIRSFTYKKELDIVVPRASLPIILEKIKDIGSTFGFETVNFGHAGDGNLHINILRNNLNDDFWDNKLPIAVKKIFMAVKECGGLLSGEHGIGIVQKPYMELVYSPIHIALMRQIKKVFDPNNIMNPNKIF